MRLLAILFIISWVLITPIAAVALTFSNPTGGIFGGRIILIIPCTCSVPPTMLKITVGPPKEGSFIYIPGISTLYKFYKLLPPSWVLGTSLGRRECLVGIPPACFPAGAGGTIIKMTGTSLF
ncbi:MAG: hypothetical protein A2915_04575 [Candidatus Yanofskybacteria bacterium RIFCSPLOWO2_01_FULL_41_34]|nr:MAG: hypothetical protein A2915_04575 [Candidatus Yanofskybacteria bacterium RIFCSPLOWO2_01_FULL_41_34]